ncbi:MAG: YbgC/FadM family acyl-CoA thioesterase [Elusimicrobia bacterium]|nr:YbgC/FadM family acyl-CoA thioesterase [Elusimicrobiota bacterium]
MERQIYYHDTDAGGVVYYANYLKYMEEARTDYLLARGVRITDLIARGILFAVRSCSLDYRAPARYGDVVLCDAVIEKLTGARVFFRQKVVNKVSGDLLVEADVVLACLGERFRPCPIPTDIKERLA